MWRQSWVTIPVETLVVPLLVLVGSWGRRVFALWPSSMEGCMSVVNGCDPKPAILGERP